MRDINTKIIALCVISFFLCTSVSTIVAKQSDLSEQYIEEKMEVTLTASSYEIIQTSSGESLIKMVDFGSYLQPGYPKLPSKIFSVGIPTNAELVSIELIDVSSIILPGTYDIEETKPLYPLGNNFGYDEERNPILTNDPYPSSPYSFVGKGAYLDYTYLRIRFNPFTYHPIEKTLTLHHYITLEITYTIVQEQPDFYGHRKEQERYAAYIIDNFEEIPKTTSSFNAESAETYEYIIITTKNLEESVIFLKYWRELRGLSTKIVNMSWIFDHYSGIDVQERIHNFLKDKYLEWGIQYVLIVGSDSLIPMRDCYADSSNHGYSGITPTDYYYADLTSDWDADGCIEEM